MTATMRSVSDEDEAPPPVSLPVPPVQASRSGVLVQKLYCEYPAVANGAEHDGFAVMVHLKAPALVTTAPLDLVAVLDVSKSMAGGKLVHVKRAMAFVIDRLGLHDRLSVVAFSGDARQVIPLTRMTDDGKATAKLAVDALEASTTADPTNVRAGLDEAANVLRGRRQRNDVDIARVILVSDGHDSCAVPEFFLRDSDWIMPRTPVHTFGLGSDMDNVAGMYNISEATGGTFSYIEDHADIQDAVVRCIGGLRSVTAQEVYLQISCAEHPDYDVKVTAVKSGSYKTEFEGSCEKVDVHLGELYADEERRIMLFLDIPSVDDEDWTSTSLVNLHCSYTDVASGQEVLLEDCDYYYDIERPVEVTDVARCVEVERELLRVAAAEDMALARDAAERGAYDEAARIIDARRESLIRSAPARAGDAMCTAVAAELHELSQRVSDEREYRKTGRACILASMSSHGLQRGSSPVRFGCVGSSVFATPAMRKMEKLSEMMRKQQEVSPPLPVDGSKTGVPVNGSKTGHRRSAWFAPSRGMVGVSWPLSQHVGQIPSSSTQAISKTYT